MTDQRTPPNDTAAEHAVLGAMLLSQTVADEMTATLRAEDFYDPRAGLAFAAIHDMRAADLPTGAVAVAAWLTERGQIVQAGGGPTLHGYLEAAPAVASAGYYAGIVRDRAKLRAVAAFGTRVVQRAYNPDGDTADDIAEWAHEQAAQVRDLGYAGDDLASAITLDEAVDVEITHDWVVPGLIERGDRLLLTGGEGGGKSTMLRQIAVCAAAGVHPFTAEYVAPRRVLLVDCENGPSLTARRLRPLRDAALGAGRPVRDGMLWIQLRTVGLDLTGAADTRWLVRQVETLTPDLLVIGPLYRLHAGDPNDEQQARQVARVLDRCRDKAGCALVMETHSPHGNGIGKRPLRPIGSSLWLRWPEFGYGIRAADESGASLRRLCDLVPWRGPRDERHWPERIEAGSPWPWAEAYPAGFTRRTA